MSGLIGKKIGMTSIFSDEGKNIPCTILEVGPCKVVQIKTEEVDVSRLVRVFVNNRDDLKRSVK